MNARSRRVGSSGSAIPPFDPTEQTPAENPSFNESEDRFQKLFLSAKDAILITDSVAGQVLDVNLQACAMLGYSRSELLSLPPTRILTRKEDLFAWLRNSAKKSRLEMEFRHKTGAVVPCDISARPIEFAQAFHLGASGYVTKSAPIEELLAEVRKLLVETF